MIEITIKWTTWIVDEIRPLVYYRRNGRVGGRVTKVDIIKLIDANVIRDARLIEWVKVKWQTPKALATPKPPPIERKREDGGLKGHELYKHLESLYAKVKTSTT